MAKNKNLNLHDAKRNKKDEFYTQLRDIENELLHYTGGRGGPSHFENKVVFCNCDDPKESQFFVYFACNFNHLKLKKLICTCYANSPISLFENRPNKIAHKIIITQMGDFNNDGVVDYRDADFLIEKARKEGNTEVLEVLKGTTEFAPGDFRSPECVELLKQADIVVTNPPFSLFREYVAQLMGEASRRERERERESNPLKFLIIGPVNAITYKDIFCLIKENRLWLGFGFRAGNAFFRVAGDNREFAAGVYDEKTGLVKFRNCTWYTNLDHKKRHEFLETIASYKKTPERYPKYDNYDAINVDKTKDIPLDYDGVMGVPITFLDKYNPEQFEIEALGIVGSIDFSCNKKMEILDKNGLPTGKFTYNAKGTLYRKYNPQTDKAPAFKDCETGELYSSIYARLLIRPKPQKS